MKIVHVIKHVFILFFSYLHNAEECLNRPDTGIRSCTSTKMNSYSDKSESERILWSKTQVLSGMKCSLLCIEDISCVSYFYNNSTQTCTGHSIMFGNSSAASNQDGNVFYHFIDADGYIGALCNSNLDCTVTNSECRADCKNTTESSECTAKRCWCTPGYSFSPSQHNCQPSCTQYGTDYIRTFLHFLSANAGPDFTEVTLDDCKQNCTSATTMTCRSFQYGADNHDCYLMNRTKLDFTPEKWLYDKYYFQYSYYQRDCQ